MNRRQVLRLCGAALAATASAGCSATGGSDGVKRVSMNDDFEFDPKRSTISAGTTVRWTNDTEVGHTVTAYDGRISSDAAYFASGGFESEQAARNDISGGLIASGDTYEHTFEIPGTYEYV
ncbi:copper-binding protein [Haloferax sp. Atlit-10N]|uniref:cupredoxin domain-containing protein n=1 Tax=unclassified Haloferax TaxID=2625095 RepID=UPI000E25CE48|nr:MULTISPECIES: plastocyanin/azurin family copper-binding protein [unclassified Haloferax]RDZ39578.1 copper-binding protein [Haloferax sp. Atlit-16N]RDZ55975.1 copper-binding protein [Haloferax sp. Atlit-10N]